MKARKTERVPHCTASTVGRYLNEGKWRFGCPRALPPFCFQRVINLVKQSQITNDGWDKMETDG